MSERSEALTPSRGPLLARARGLAQGLSLLALGAALAWAAGAPIPGLALSAILASLVAGSAWALSLGLERSAAQPTSACLLFFLAGSSLASLERWPTPSELSAPESPGFLGLWLVIVPLALRLPPWAGPAGLTAAWTSLLARGLALQALPGVADVALGSLAIAACALSSSLLLRRDGDPDSLGYHSL